ncbi:hypothetical protein AB0G04_29645 [Actinoplanes sp. NPDC023801]|uniref:hypothetical protein n=1 Tax=Actinoplanes sp. NPDC023801 TaxID=3154595 RepID=UPI0034033D67
MKFSDDRLRAALRAEAASHRPDRDAMLDRITMAAMRDTGHARRMLSLRGRTGAVVATVVAIFGGGGVGTWALTGAGDRGPVNPALPVTTTATTPSPGGTTPAGATPSAAPTKPVPSRGTPSERPGTPATATPSSSPTRERPPRTGVSQGPLWSDGSIDPDSGDTTGASVVTLKTTQELTALDVVIRVARTDGLTSRGGTKQTPGASVTATVTEEAGAYLYRFTLSSADTLDPGTYTFTARYTYPSGGRDAGGDTYRAVATAAGGNVAVQGDFPPTG